jgi:hypothetical protein
MVSMFGTVILHREMQRTNIAVASETEAKAKDLITQMKREFGDQIMVGFHRTRKGWERQWALLTLLYHIKRQIILLRLKRFSFSGTITLAHLVTDPYTRMIRTNGYQIVVGFHNIHKDRRQWTILHHI